MEITLSTEMLAGIATSAVTLIGALIGTLVLSVRAIGNTSKSIVALTETNIKFNDELQENSAERRESETERAQLRQQIQAVELDCAQRESKFTNKIAQLEQRANEREAAMRAEITDLREKLEGAQQRISDLEARERALIGELEKAKKQIADLQREGRLKDDRLEQLQQRVSDLENELEASRRAQDKLQAERDSLIEQLEKLKQETENND
jgi:chromosome segregation ATPase